MKVSTVLKWKTEYQGSSNDVKTVLHITANYTGGVRAGVPS